ncbi:MAG: diaminopimelate epimerase [Gammaproteobacteria bacterium]|nr:diaminopimelate epimerase [Gammaproteobacteria bacterium]MDH5618960.1 diaminopimelate epimerase [Gammaproteobacteria bacterium]
MKIAYTKMHGTGNRILVVDQRSGASPPPSPQQLRELGNDATGPGFDQLMWVTAADDPAFAASYRVFNNDGSEVEQCGNGVRCVASVLANESGHRQAFTLQSPAGPIDARIDDDGLVAVSMGTPEFEPSRIPFIAAQRAARYRLDVGQEHYDACVVSMGNPHCVLHVDDVDAAPVNTLGPVLERHERFPQHANVGFARIRDRESIDLRVFERGVGETAACGTGACAAVVTGQALGLLAQAVDVRLPGGQVVVSWRGGSEPVWLMGNAEYISEGIMDL